MKSLQKFSKGYNCKHLVDCNPGYTLFFLFLLKNIDCGYSLEPPRRWPRWLSWMRRPTGDQEVAGSTPAEVGNILSWRLIIKYFLRSFSPFR